MSMDIVMLDVGVIFGFYLVILFVVCIGEYGMVGFVLLVMCGEFVLVGLCWSGNLIGFWCEVIFVDYYVKRV